MIKRNLIAKETILGIALFIFVLTVYSPSSWAGGSLINRQFPTLSSYDYTDQLIIKYRNPSLVRAATANNSNTSLMINERVNTLSSRAGIALTHFRFMSDNGHVVKLPQRMTLTEASAVARKIAADPNVEYAEPDVRMFPMLTPNDPQYTNQWHYKSPTTDSEPGGSRISLERGI